ncbi:hypothetical protein Nmel_001488, partial [Mimus melanotis]
MSLKPELCSENSRSVPISGAVIQLFKLKFRCPAPLQEPNQSRNDLVEHGRGTGLCLYCANSLGGSLRPLFSLSKEESPEELRASCSLSFEWTTET